MKKFFLLLLCLLPVFAVCQADTRDAQLTDLKIAYLEHMKHPPREKTSRTFYAVGTIITDDPLGAAFYDGDRLAGRYFSGMPIEAFDPPINGKVCTEIDSWLSYFDSDCVCFDPELLPEYVQFVSGRVLKDIAPHKFDNPSALYLDDRVTVLGYKTDPQGNPTEYLVDTGKAWFYLPAEYIRLYTPASFEVGQTGIINTNKVNVRRGAGTSNPRAYYADKWDKVYIREIKTLENGETWLHISGEGARSRTANAWVRCEYVFVDKPANVLNEQQAVSKAVEIDAFPHQMEPIQDAWALSNEKIIYAHTKPNGSIAAVCADPENGTAHLLTKLCPQPGHEFRVEHIQQMEDSLIFAVFDCEDNELWAASTVEGTSTVKYRKLFSYTGGYVNRIAAAQQGFFVMDVQENGIRYSLINKQLEIVFEKTLTEVSVEGHGAIPIAYHTTPPNAFCAAHDDRFYLCFTLETLSKSVLCCFDAAGSMLWHTVMPCEDFITSQIIFQGERLFVSALKTQNASEILCYSANGELLWKKDNTAWIDFNFVSQNEQSLIALARQDRYDQSTLYLLSPEMEVIRRYPFEHPEYQRYQKLLLLNDGRAYICGIHYSAGWEEPANYACIWLQLGF